MCVEPVPSSLLQAMRKYMRGSGGQCPMRRRNLFAGLLALASCTAAADLPVAPPFPAIRADAWINSPPLSLAGLKGQVILVEFWTFGCSNCRNTLPWLKRVAA